MMAIAAQGRAGSGRGVDARADDRAPGGPSLTGLVDWRAW
jgi:hypothetical protein